MGRRVIDGLDCSRLLIDVPTRILIDIRSTDITPAIGLVNSQPSPVLPIQQPLIISMSSTFSSIFTTGNRIEAVRSLCAARGSGRHCSLLDNNQGRAARRMEARREVTPFDFNISRYQVSPSFISHVVTARLIYNLRSLGGKKDVLIRMPRPSMNVRRRYGQKKGLTLGARGYITSGYIVI